MQVVYLPCKTLIKTTKMEGDRFDLLLDLCQARDYVQYPTIMKGDTAPTVLAKINEEFKDVVDFEGDNFA